MRGHKSRMCSAQTVCRTKNEKGIALLMAVIGALLVSATAAIVLSMTYRSFYLSVFQTDHAVAFYSAESGVQYTFSRLQLDTTYVNPAWTGDPTPPAAGFANSVQYCNTVKGRSFVVSCDPAVAADLTDPNLHAGKKHVTIQITYNAASTPPYTVKSTTSYG